MSQCNNKVNSEKRAPRQISPGSFLNSYLAMVVMPRKSKIAILKGQ